MFTEGDLLLKRAIKDLRPLRPRQPRRPARH